MTLTIVTTTSDGIVLAADSRQSYRNRKGITRIGSDNASKLFQLNKRIGVTTAGMAFLLEDGVPKNISKFFNDFKRNNNDIDEFDIRAVTEKLHQFFEVKTQWKERLKKKFEKIKGDLQKKGCEIVDSNIDGYPGKIHFKTNEGELKEDTISLEILSFSVAGYNRDGSHEVHICSIPGETKKLQDSKERKEYGSSWLGQTDVVSRIILGFDARIQNLPFFNEAVRRKNIENINKELNLLQYNIEWGTMTLQDAINFSTLMIETTSAIQRFSDGIVSDPGDIPGVGGAIDVAVITPENGFVWINKKVLQFGGNNMDLK